MSTQQNFDGKIIILPGVYSNIKSGFKNPPSPVAYGNLLIIDTGSGGPYGGGGAGIKGTISKGADAVYEFDNKADFQSFVERNLWYLLATPLFEPVTESNITAQGVSKITYIKAATTVPATMNFAVGQDASDSVGNVGNVKIQVRSEGPVGNGDLNSKNELGRGYAFKLIAGVLDSTKYIMNFYRGTFRGLDQNGDAIGGISENDSVGELLVQSKEFKTLSALATWMGTSSDFNKYFRYDAATSVFGIRDRVDIGDLHDYEDYTLATGGTENYDGQSFIDALEVAKNMNLDFVFADKYGADSQHQHNIDLAAWAVNDAKFKPQLYIASGNDADDFATVSIADAALYNSQQVTIVHGGAKINKNNNAGFSVYDSYYKAAILLGREAGLQPQIPLTFKNISIDGEVHILNELEQKKALNAGLLVSVPDNGNFEILKGVNSLQANEFLLNDNGTTHSKQLYRIAHQLNKEIVITAKNELLKNPDGTNRNTLSALDVQQWLKRFLFLKIAEPSKDNLILSFQDVTVTRQADAYYVSYKFVANTEISFLFFTGLLIDVN